MAAPTFALGMTMDQVDTLDRLMRMITVYGDVIATGSAANFDHRTLPALGEAIYDAAHAVRGVLDEVIKQRL
ncbi:hypothetical protein AB8810_16910 [Xanthomonas sp. NCPPB 3005]|uniref:hypothetical protein n=1 Tax=Xanthomonas sp. NCPPB 3005 TaxID=3240913 RepID=UPI0035181634